MQIDDLSLGSASLIEDLDDDNDGVDDRNDTYPTNAALAGDPDADGVDTLVDNCRSNANANQLNTDGDAEGDVCDSDDDNDGKADTSDNCPLISNADQLDSDNDYQGDVCDAEPLVAPAGSLDFSFNPAAPNSYVYSVGLETDGKVFIAGAFSSVAGTTKRYIARLQENGALDASFIQASYNNFYIESIAVQTDGKVVIAGDFTVANGGVYNRIARLNTDGSLDTAFNPGSGANAGIKRVQIQPDGKIVIAGRFTTFNGIARNRIARLNADGSLDTGFDPGTGVGNSSPLINTVLLLTDGKIVIGGSFTSVSGTLRNNIARLNADGSLDAGFDPGTAANNPVYALALQPDNRIVPAGSFSVFNGLTHSRLARLDTNGTLDAAFGLGVSIDNSVNAIALQPDGKFIISGDFSTVGGIARPHIARLHSDGSLDASFNPGSGTYGYINTIVMQPDGKIIIAGDFTSYDGKPRTRVARIHTGDTDSDGIEDASDVFPDDTDNDGLQNGADLDDDNDGVPDYIDAAPLNPANASESILPVNSNYQGSAVNESQTVQ